MLPANALEIVLQEVHKAIVERTNELRKEIREGFQKQYTDDPQRDMIESVVFRLLAEIEELVEWQIETVEDTKSMY